MDQIHWDFRDDFAGDVEILGVVNSSSAHTDNRKNNIFY